MAMKMRKAYEQQQQQQQLEQPEEYENYDEIGQQNLEEVYNTFDDPEQAGPPEQQQQQQGQERTVAPQGFGDQTVLLEDEPPSVRRRGNQQPQQYMGGDEDFLVTAPEQYQEQQYHQQQQQQQYPFPVEQTPLDVTYNYGGGGTRAAVMQQQPLMPTGYMPAPAVQPLRPGSANKIATQQQQQSDIKFTQADAEDEAIIRKRQLQEAARQQKILQQQKQQKQAATKATAIDSDKKQQPAPNLSSRGAQLLQGGGQTTTVNAEQLKKQQQQAPAAAVQQKPAAAQQQQQSVTDLSYMSDEKKQVLVNFLTRKYPERLPNKEEKTFHLWTVVATRAEIYALAKEYNQTLDVGSRPSQNREVFWFALKPARTDIVGKQDVTKTLEASLKSYQSTLMANSFKNWDKNIRSRYIAETGGNIFVTSVKLLASGNDSGETLVLRCGARELNRLERMNEPNLKDDPRMCMALLNRGEVSYEAGRNVFSMASEFRESKVPYHFFGSSLNDFDRDWLTATELRSDHVAFEIRPNSTFAHYFLNRHARITDGGGDKGNGDPFAGLEITPGWTIRDIYKDGVPKEAVVAEQQLVTTDVAEFGLITSLARGVSSKEALNIGFVPLQGWTKAWTDPSNEKSKELVTISVQMTYSWIAPDKNMLEATAASTATQDTASGATSVANGVKKDNFMKGLQQAMGQMLRITPPKSE
jgi:hypothetical protein